MAAVYIKKTGEDLDAALGQLLKPVAGDVALQGATVLIKPNLVEPEHYTTGQTTNPAVVEAIILWCRRQGAAKIAVGEGPSYFQPASDLRLCFTATGIADVCARQEVPWILFDDGPFREFRRHSPFLPDLFHVSEHAFSWDRIINVPVPKTHYLTTVSSAMKNLKGFVKRDNKPSFHYCGTHRIHGAVTGLNQLIRPSLTVVDCTAPVHRNAGFLLAGTDIVALDAVTASLMGLNPSTIETIRMGHEAGLGEMDMAQIDIIGDETKDLAMNFVQPREYLERVFPHLNLVAERACSGCLIPIFHGLRRLEREGAKSGDPITFAAGEQNDSADACGEACIGKCTEGMKGAAWLPGCPPTKEEVFEFLKAQFNREP